MKEEYKGTTKLYSRCTEVEAVVLANGEYPTASLPLHILESAPYVVCCDGGADEYIRQGHIPNLIIGDGDSICEENRRKAICSTASPNRRPTTRPKPSATYCHKGNAG